MELMKRDIEILNFLEICPADSITIQKLFFPSQRVCNERLRKLYSYGYLKRTRQNVNEFYVYYIGRKPVQIKHCSYVAKSYHWIQSQGYIIEKFKREVTFENIRSDALFKINNNNQQGYLFLEVELSKNNVNNKLRKYENLYLTQLYKKYFDTMPKILYATNQNVNSDILNIINVKINELLV